MISKETILGVINLYVKDGHQRNQSEEVFLTAIANTLAGIILRKKAEDALKQGITNLRLTLEGTVKTLAIITEKRDPYTAGHQQRVAELASNIAREMGLPAEQIESIRIAGTLHDIGKISIPSDILNKPSELTELEKALIFTHPQAGYDMLRTIPFSFPAAEIILQHHERIDGSGYPNGIKGDAILLEAKIIAVADVVEAMLSHRPYRPALSLEEALYEINRHRNSLFDAEVVDACIRLLLVTI
ncbi:MAG: HD-GYP domain-containing protein [Firmicutes bacterium]|nr:HD-GYP domain-containing protein [Bacillota bacterium]